MNTNPASSYHYADFQGFSDLRRMAREDSPEAADTAARQFEALFIQMMLKSMRDAAPVDSGMDGQQMKFYRDMFDQQIALEMSQGEGIGLRTALLRELHPSAVNGPEAAVDMTLPMRRFSGRTTEAPPTVGSAPGSERSSGPVTPTTRFGSPEEFVQSLWPHAEEAGRALGVAPEVLLAQSALETGWGRHMIGGANGANSFNLFGIKADTRWAGPAVNVPTLEYVDGIPERQSASFRSYSSPAESFSDYVDFLRSNPRYREALSKAPDPEGYLRGLQAAGYATDPNYADKILDIMNRGILREVADLKNGGSRPLS
ncbi:MAG TPA: flagellar assembly peptidoglycan hydrolase FlgJ [Thioalkalivibrio sp.]|nr:flagellar assembly peptidoglycan hydrolase FlgJ [Thioalkalivibrio sp.]